MLTDEQYTELFERYYTPLTIFANRYLNDEDQASDVVQNLFVNLYDNRQTLEVQNAKSFLYTASRNACLNIIKHQKIKRQYYDETLATTPDLSTDNPENLIRTAETQARIAAALNRLSPQCQRIFTLSRLEGLTNQEIADRLELSKRTVETQITNALRILRRLLLFVFYTISFH